MSDRRRWQLEGDIRQAIENYLGGATVSGPWDKVIEAMAAVIDNGFMTLEEAAYLSHNLTQTQGPEASPDTCQTCDQPLVQR